jgi:hypothetical protein
MSEETRKLPITVQVTYQVALLRHADPEIGAALHAASGEFLIEHRDRILVLLQIHTTALAHEDVEGLVALRSRFRKLLGMGQ